MGDSKDRFQLFSSFLKGLGCADCRKIVDQGQRRKTGSFLALFTPPVPLDPMQDLGMVVVAWPLLARHWGECLRLRVLDDELELLLMSQPALVHRMKFKWSALAVVGQWIVQRLRLQTANPRSGLDHDR